MKIKTNELIGAALDWAVAKCEGTLSASYGDWTQTCPHYSTDWAQGGPIIEQDEITLCHMTNDWIAVHNPSGNEQSGPTPLIAAMRCYVVSKLGNEVEVPDEAINKWSTPQAASGVQSSKCTAADGKTEIFNVPGYPLMVSAVDFNRLFYDTCTHCTLQSNDQLSMKRATVVDCGNLYATIKLHDEAFGTTKIGDIFYGVS